MNNIAVRRFLAFIIDITIVSMLFFIVASLIPETYQGKVIGEKLVELNQSLFRQEIVFNEYYADMSNYFKELDIQRFRFNIVNFLFLIVYFGILPIYNKGRTLGHKLFNLKIVKEGKNRLEIKDLVFRSFLINGLIYSVVSFVTMSFLSGEVYYYLIMMISLLQFLLVMVHSFMVVYKKEKRGVIDILTKTSIVEAKEG